MEVGKLGMYFLDWCEKPYLHNHDLFLFYFSYSTSNESVFFSHGYKQLIGKLRQITEALLCLKTDNVMKYKFQASIGVVNGLPT